MIKNMFRFDGDSSGTVSFQEFIHLLLLKGKFLFKIHCGQISLRRMHIMNQISHSAQRKITLEQFNKLIVNGYKFLGVTVHLQITQYKFNTTDTDHDSVITYVEYFKIINNYFCKPGNKQTKIQKPIGLTGKQKDSRLSSYMWIQLEKLYQSYINGPYLSASAKQLRGLILQLLEI